MSRPKPQTYVESFTDLRRALIVWCKPMLRWLRRADDALARWSQR